MSKLASGQHGVLISIMMSAFLMLPGVYLWVMRFGGVLPLETCLQDVQGITCSGVWSWQVYAAVILPLVVGYWMLRGYRWGTKKEVTTGGISK